MAGRKPESSRLNVFYILHILSDHSDESRPLSAAEIADMVNREFSYLADSGELISTDTVKRILDELTDKIFPQETESLDILRRYGIFVHMVRKKGRRYIPYYQEDEECRSKRYYYLEKELKEAEIITLKDAVEAHCYFSEMDTAEIIRKLLRFAPQKLHSSGYYDKARDDRSDNSRLLINIDFLSGIIREHKGARIVYCSYDINKRLVPRPGYPQIVEPVDMMWSNGFYYLLVYMQKYDEIVNLRIDRITEIEEVELEYRHEGENFNPVRYRHEHPAMFSGPQGRVRLLCRNQKNNYMMNILMDAFGKNARIRKASDALVEKYLGRSAEDYAAEGYIWLEVVVNTTLWGIELWALQYCNECRIIAPKESVERVMQCLREAGGMYWRELKFK